MFKQRPFGMLSPLRTDQQKKHCPNAVGPPSWLSVQRSAALGGRMHVSIGAAIFILGVIYFSIVSPGFRIVLLSVLGLAVFGFVTLIFAR